MIKWWVLPGNNLVSFVYQVRKCEFIKTICNGLSSVLSFENEIVLLKGLITGLLTFKYYFGHVAGGQG